MSPDESASFRPACDRCLLGLGAIIRFTLARKGLATGSGTDENKREEVRSSVRPRGRRRGRRFRQHPGEERSRGGCRLIAVDYASQAVQDSPGSSLLVYVGEVEFGAQEAKHACACDSAED